MAEEKLYIGSKIIAGCPMDEFTFLKIYRSVDITNSSRVSRAGYKVTYQDGYVSWSPKDTFENAYREVSPAERKLF